MRFSLASSLAELVAPQLFESRDGQELLEILRRRELAEEGNGLAEAAAIVRLGAHLAAHALHLLADQAVEELARRFLPVGERDAVMDPLPHLRAADLGSRR